jgi:hypothetical protein
MTPMAMNHIVTRPRLLMLFFLCYYAFLFPGVNSRADLVSNFKKVRQSL